MWRIDPSTLPPFNPSNKKSRWIVGGPLIDLLGLQSLLKSTEFDLDALWVATDRCELDLENYRWTYEDVVHMLGCLLANDYGKSEWCQVKGGSVVACDVYVMPYDDARRQRSAKGLEVYMKFSIDVSGALTLVLVSCHPPR
ncbi:hypothetical protein [Polaromonas sp. UBA4122]|uniref:hypothetical protein n=1 Tax=Polaromonas sp. UBA4122 TaxID=1947074 RepID=UPI0025F97DE1|nr:hypothetical protein [Polaromonas sp. UBA4122]